MAQEDKELLLRDLSARLPYNVYVYFKTRYRCNAITDVLNGAIYTYIETHLLEDDGENEIDIIKPYLRPMSSMTEKEYKEVKANGCIIYHDTSPKNRGLMVTASPKGIDWLNAHHFDYRGLIPMGLALEAPKDMYRI